jgi:hypothetical protein
VRFAVKSKKDLKILKKALKWTILQYLAHHLAQENLL